MKAGRNILIAFILNLFFAVFEIIGGIFTGSVAIVSDAVHDAGDAVSIGIAYFLERKSKQKSDEKYTYGYARYSVMGGLVTTVVLLFGSLLMLYNAVCRIIDPIKINYSGMILFAVLGVSVNFCAAFFTRGGYSINQRAVNLHMLEDVLGWAVVLVGAVVMRFTDFSIIDPVISIGVSVFILANAVMNLKRSADVFLEKAPNDISVPEVKAHIMEIDGVLDVHHVHLWSIDGQKIFTTMHVVTDSEMHKVKGDIRRVLRTNGVEHVTVEIELSAENCHERECCLETAPKLECSHKHEHKRIQMG